MKVKHLWLFFAALLAAGCFLLCYGAEPLRVSGIWWTLEGYHGSDITQHQAGWMFYRHSAWSFPLSKALNLAYPEGTCISFTDSIPLAALFFKILSPILPQNFQYFGWWVFLSFILQGIFAALLIECFTADKFYSIIAALLFVIAPSFLDRQFRHTALGSHWVLLATAYIYFRRDKKHAALCFGILCCLSLGIHPYLSAMVCGFFAFYEAQSALQYKTRRKSLKETLLVFAVYATFGYILGVFGSPLRADRASGYGSFGFNLNALFNPYTGNETDLSRFTAARPIYGRQKDGCFYFGIAALIALSLLVLHTLSGYLRGQDKRAEIHSAVLRNRFYLLYMALLGVYAVSHVVTFDDRLLFTFSLPDAIHQTLSVFRASDRFFWPVYYSLFLLLAVALYRQIGRKRLAYLAISLIVTLQLADISPLIASSRAYFAERTQAPELASIWYEIGENYDRLVVFDNKEDRPLAFWAATKQMKTNLNISAFIQRNAYMNHTEEARRAIREQLENGEALDPNTLYVIMDRYCDRCVFTSSEELNYYADRIAENYSASADLEHMTNGVSNYWFLIPRE